MVNLPFGDTFTFTRPIAATYRDPAGATVMAAVDVPRFDHSADGLPLGILVEGGAFLGEADSCTVRAGSWELNGPATVLHEHAAPGGDYLRRAFYTKSVRAAVNAALRAAGHHRVIAAVPGFLRNKDGAVRFRQLDWQLPSPIAIGDGVLLGDGSTMSRPLIEG